MSIFLQYTPGMKNQPKGRGRPKKSSDQLQTVSLDVRCAIAEKDTFKAAADLAGMPLSMWVRQCLRQMATKQLHEAGQEVAFQK